ncbi:hypothetical protein ACIO7M_25045 [Streptomyces toxytricini]|uniref:DUF1795 domain-containing protein n=1 Tax=Streptomyces toxytricini TaxID=67369 RepID=A0ABW8EM77_STRT5
MPTALPVPIEFRLPDGWLPARPEGDTDVAFAARHPEPDHGFAANITLDGGYPPQGKTLAECADDALERLHGATESVRVLQRQEFGDADAPGLTQRLSFSVVVGGVRRALVQSQVFVSVVDVADPDRRALVRLVLTATAAQFDSVLPDFQEFLRTVRTDSWEGA